MILLFFTLRRAAVVAKVLLNRPIQLAALNPMVLLNSPIKLDALNPLTKAKHLLNRPIKIGGLNPPLLTRNKELLNRPITFCRAHPKGLLHPPIILPGGHLPVTSSQSVYRHPVLHLRRFLVNTNAFLNRPIILSRPLSWYVKDQIPRALNYFRSRPLRRSWYYYLASTSTVWYLSHSKSTVPYTKRSRRVLIPPSLDGYMGCLAFHSLKERENLEILPPTHPDSIRVKGISDRIIQAVRRGSCPLRPPPLVVLVVNDDDMINAVCLPGGKIMVYTGLLRYFTDDEIAMVIAHEVGHAIARHGAEAISQYIVLKLLSMFVYVPYLTNYLWKLLRRLPSYRRMELEADCIGLMLVASAGYSPRIGPKLYEKLGQLMEEDEGESDFFSTHPTCKKRSQLLSRDEIMDEALVKFWESIAEHKMAEFL